MHQEVLMAFDVQVWRERVAQRTMGWKDRWEQAQAAGVTSLYAFLSAMALWPVVEAYQQGDLAAILALGGVVAGVGGNLLANQIQSWKDETDAARTLARAAMENEDIRSAIDAVLEHLQVIPQAQSALSESDRAWFAGTLREELARLGNLERPHYHAILTGSGAVAQGPGAKAAGEGGVVADAVHGTVITGDQSKVIQAETYVERQEIVDPALAREDQSRQRYLKRLYHQCNALPLGAMGGDEGTGEEVALDQVYVALNTRTQVSVAQEEKMQRPPGREEQRPLTALEATIQNRRLVLLGDPGSGKSTFVRQLAAWLAAALLEPGHAAPVLEPGLVPVMVILRELGVRLAQLDLDGLSQPEQERRLVQAVRRHWQEELEACRSGEWATCLEDVLMEGDVLLIFDGLDEVAEASRGQVRQAVQALLRTYPNVHWVIVTSRIRSYVDEAVLPGFTQHTLAPFDQEQIAQFVAGWYNAQVHLGRMNETQAQANTSDLQQAALSPDLRELASNPMLLTTMAIIHQREIGLPRERVRLYSLAVQVLLSRWQTRKGIAVSESLAAVLRDDLKLRTIMERLAYEVHCQQAQRPEAADLLRKDLLVLLEDPAYLGNVGLTGEFLDYVDQRAGLLVGRGGDETGRYPHAYRFPHRTFQEYLAGCFMVGRRRRGVVREYWQRAAEGDTWYLAALLGGEELLYNRRRPEELLDLAYDLCPDATPAGEDAWRAALWSGQMAVRLGAEEVRRDTERPDGGYAYLKRLVPRLVEILRQAPLSPIERAEAGNVLAQLGDPRFREDAWHLPDEPLLGFVEIPRGAFQMGSDKRRDGMAYDDEQPQHPVTLPAYCIARYPVTVAQFDAFVDAGGYRAARYWLEAEAAGLWDGGQFKGRYDDEPRDRPVGYGEPFNLPNHPVVGVTWYEALAYCRWLTERLREWVQTPERLAALVREQGWQVILPSEAEWERAARGGDGRVFPWGEDADPNRANYGGTGIEATSAVGCFPGGASPYGVEDLSGNVWGWTRSHWRDYPYGPADGREDLRVSDDVPRVLRGGAFFNYRWSVRCAYRRRNGPYNRYNYVGFRLVMVSPSTLDSERSEL
jgi:formylglycine-generating enzyme required for sulfatase activity